MHETTEPAAVTSAGQSSESLGHPPDARLLIVNCDDFAMSRPTHLDLRCLADGSSDDILNPTVLLAAEYGLAVRVRLEPGRRTTRQRGLPVLDNDFLDTFALDIDGKAARYAQTSVPPSARQPSRW